MLNSYHFFLIQYKLNTHMQSGFLVFMLIFTHSVRTRPIIKTIRDSALTGKVGDGKIFVHDMAEVIRIRTNESGMAAL